jgi:hypothetical protein
MRIRASLVWRLTTAVAFGVTAAVAVTLSRGVPVNAALTSDKGTGAGHASAAASPSNQQADLTAECVVAGLRISLGPGARVTTAITRYALEFTNVSGAPCTLAGYPQVTAYRGDGIPVGPLAARDTSVAARLVLLAPGQTAHAILDATMPAARCRPVSASGLRVIAPGQTGARYVRQPLRTCAARVSHGQNYLLVHAIQPGAGISAGRGTGSGTGTVANAAPATSAARLSSTVA